MPRPLTNLHPIVRAALVSILAVLAGPASAIAESGHIEGRLARLVAAYPDFLAGIDGGHLLWKDGTRMVIDDGRGPKSLDARLADPDIEDMFWVPYPRGTPAGPPAIDADPGRVRHQALFDKMYGECAKGGVQASLVEIIWLPTKARQVIKVSRINGAAQRLEAVSLELDRLPAAFDPYLIPAAGTFNCRPIAGTARPSAHGHGIAIDIALRHAHYWRWSKAEPEGRVAWRNSIPPEIVAIFEKHGFIWGGRWYHYDTMHFEYRPELLD